MTDALRAAAEQALFELRTIRPQNMGPNVHWVIKHLAAALDAAPVAPAVPAETVLNAAMNTPGDVALFFIWEQAAHYSEDFNQLVRLKTARDIVAAVLQATIDWSKTPAAPQPTPAAAVPSAEPVAWRVRRHDAPNYWIIFLHKPVDALADPEREVQPLYAAPQPAAVPQPLTDELDAYRVYVRELCRAVDAATDFAGTVAGGASWWDDVWAEHKAALDKARDAITGAAREPKA